jgi:hypothetical protein
MTPDEIKSVELYIEAPVLKADGAKSLSKAVIDYVQLARLFLLNQKPEAIPLLDAIKVMSKDNKLIINLHISPDTVKSLRGEDSNEK